MIDDPRVKERRERLSQALAEEIAACSNGYEKHNLIEAAIRLAIDAYTVRFRDGTRSQKEACISDLRDFLEETVDDFRRKLLHK